MDIDAATRLEDERLGVDRDGREVAVATVVVAVGAWAVGTTANHDVSGDLAAPGGAAPGTVFGDGLRAIKVDALRAGELPILPPAAPRSVKPVRTVGDS